MSEQHPGDVAGRQSSASTPAGTTPLEVARVDRAAARPRHRGRPLDGAARRPARAARRGRRASASSPPRTPRRGEVIRHSAEHVLADAVERLWPGTHRSTPAARTTPRSSSTTSASRGRSRPRTSRASRRRWRADRRRGPRLRAHRGRPRVGREVLMRERGEELKLLRLADIPEGEAITLFRSGELRRPVPRPARAAHDADRGVQAARDLRRLLQGRRAQRDAAAHLRDGLRDPGGARRLLRAHRGGAAPRPPPARHGARPVLVLAAGAGDRRSSTRAAPSSTTSSSS